MLHFLSFAIFQITALLNEQRLSKIDLFSSLINYANLEEMEINLSHLDNATIGKIDSQQQPEELYVATKEWFYDSSEQMHIEKRRR